MELLDAIRSTKTCRSFRSDPIPVAVLLRAISAARFAPTGGNRQPVRFIVVRDPDAKRKLRDWYLGPHAPALFDRTGNPGPTIWVDGRVVGGWAHAAGRVIFEVLDNDVDPTGVQAAADRLTDWIGPVPVTPRFRTPLERRLTETVTPRR